MSLSRRNFLAWAGAGGALAAGAGLTSRAFGAATPRRVLEIHLGGGCSHRDATWINDPAEWATATEPGWVSLGTDFDFTCDGYAAAHPCIGVYGKMPQVGYDEDGHDVRMGAAAMAGRENGSYGLYGSAAWDRLRVLATRGPTDSHGTAPTVAATGLMPGRDRGSGLGALVQSLYGTSSAGLPSAWVLDTTNYAPSYLPFLMTGAFGPSHTPAFLPLKGAASIGALMSSRPRRPSDPLLRAYADAFAGSLIPAGSSTRARSEGYDAYRSALDRLLGTTDLWSYLQNFKYYTRATGEWWASRASTHGPLVASGSYRDNPTLLGLQLARYLFQTGGASYVCLTDGGLGTYDIHGPHLSADEHAFLTNRLLANVLDAIVDPNFGFDLDTTLIVINTEFGRVHASKVPWSVVKGMPTSATPASIASCTFASNGTPTGGFGYAQDGHDLNAWGTLLLGGPIRARAAAGSISGITASKTKSGRNPAAGSNYAWGGFADRGFAPAHVHAAAMQWLDPSGLGPFDPLTGFAPGDWGTIAGGQPSVSDLEKLVFGL